MKLRTRVSLTITIVTAITLGVSFALVLWSVRRDETHDLDKVLLEQATAVSARLLGSRDLEVDDGHVAVPEEFGLFPHYAAVYDRERNLMSATESFGTNVPELIDVLEDDQDATPKLVRFDLTIGHQALRGLALPLGSRGHTLVYAVSRHSVDRDMLFLYRTLAGLFVGAILICWLATRWLGKRIASDIQRISRVAHEVAGGELDARVGPAVKSTVETRQLALDLDYMISQLGELMSSQRTFLSHAAHELRSPLATLRGELQLALRRPRDPSEYRATLATLLEEVDALVHLAEDLLALAKLESESSDPEATTSVAALVGSALRMSAGLIEARGVTVDRPGEVLSGEEAVLVRGDLPELTRALRNLVDNAVSLSPEGATVSLGVEVGGERVRLVVDDEGPGVSEEDVPHVFTPFYRGARRRGTAESGAGLGLSIARRIARAARGEVGYEERPGPGARFVLELERVRRSVASP